MSRSPRFAIVVAIVLTYALGLWFGGESSAAVDPQPAEVGPVKIRPASRPNILFVLTDDMSRADLHTMPGVRATITRQGIRFTRAMVSVSLCCPSRTTILRGQYAHNTGVHTNGGTNGGFESAYRKGVERSTIATWLQHSGYRTGLIGKYLNGFPNGAPPGYRPPGWTDWVTPVAGDPYNEYGYVLDVNGHRVTHGFTEQDYGTRVYLRHARRFISDAARAHRPFFLDLALYAPHRPATPDPSDAHSLDGLTLPRPPSFNERDVSDKPRWLRQVPRMNAHIIERSRALFQRRRESLQAVDRAVVGLIDLLRRTHQLDNTYVVFTSDNGFHSGEHRLPAGKQTAFEEDIRVPLVIRGPGIAAGRTSGAIVGNVDFAPTFAGLAGVRPARFVDGRSLVGLLQGKRPDHPRRAYLLEHWQETGVATRQRGLPLEPPDHDDTDTPRTPRSRPRTGHRLRHPGIVDHDRIPQYQGMRTDHYTYVEYVTGERELYDLRRDPHELQNVYSRATRRTRDGLEAALAALEECRGSACRRIESRPSVVLRWSH